MRGKFRFLLSGLFLLAGVAPVAAMALPGCVSGARIVRAHGDRVAPDGTIILHDGRRAVAESIRLPAGAGDRAPGSYAVAAHAALKAIIGGHTVVLALFAPERDRYRRLRAQIFVPSRKGDVWVQTALLEAGHARVAFMPARFECAKALYDAEARARAAKRGLWAAPSYAVRKPGGLKGDLGTFQLVEGRVVSAVVKRGRAYLDFGRDWHNDFTVTVSPADMKIFRKRGVDPRSFAGKRLRVRGIVDKYHGPEMVVANPLSIEVLKR